MRDHGGSGWALLQLANTAPRPSRSGTRPPPQRDRSWCLRRPTLSESVGRRPQSDTWSSRSVRFRAAKCRVSGFAPRNAKCPVSRREMRNAKCPKCETRYHAALIGPPGRSSKRPGQSRSRRRRNRPDHLAAHAAEVAGGRRASSPPSRSHSCR